MSSKDASSPGSEGDSLPPIPRAKHGLIVGEGSKRSPRTVTTFEDSGLDLRESLASGSASRYEGGSSRAGSARNPPSLILKAATLPISPRPQSPLKPISRSLEHVRLSKSELDRREQITSSLRTENIQLQAKVRDLESCKESYAVLHSTCRSLGQTLSCNLEGVAAESVREILGGKISSLNQEHQQTLQQLSRCRSELEGSRGELAATGVRVSGLESQLEQSRAALRAREAQLQQTKSELESLQQSGARTEATMQSLRQQLAEAEGKRHVPCPCTDLQTDIGRLRTELKEKDDSRKSLEAQLAAKQEEIQSIEESASSSDAVYADLYSQLASALQLESTDSFDADYLISQVMSLVQECSDMRLRIETMTKTIKTADLDSKASRETILRLASEVKKHGKKVSQLEEMKQSQDELHQALAALEQERDALQERLLAAKETLAAQERELQGREQRLSELGTSLRQLRQTSESERAVAESAQLKFEELCTAVGTLVGSESTDSVALLQALEGMAQGASSHGRNSSTQTSLLQQLEQERAGLQGELEGAREALYQERSKVKQLEGEVVTGDIVREGMGKELEKHKVFQKKLAKALQLDTATAQILSGEFAEEAILVKADQLAKQETTALAERQSAVYSLQRRLKTARQQLESKELHLGLLQKKVTSLEERLLTYSHHEGDWEAATVKLRKLEKQIERLQARASQQRGTITQLKIENLEVEKLKRHCAEQQLQISQLSSNVEELSQSRVQQAQQLAETRTLLQRERSRGRVGGGEGEGEGEGEKERVTEMELKMTRGELERAKDKEKQLSIFKSAVQRLLSDGGEQQDKEEAPTDYDLIAKLESIVGAQQRHRETAKCLEASLKQLEVGFKAGYTDALTLLSSDS